MVLTVKSKNFSHSLEIRMSHFSLYYISIYPLDFMSLHLYSTIAHDQFIIMYLLLWKNNKRMGRYGQSCQ
ncbi:hypothetical protein BCR42DRAFT_238510 [Absidia repens]|uniref:Uncharacterized protein n=1 Tax=Absidia repens TaxID=90262 RepID=A0A1X2IJE5_9FUNG|nr:hypothetical protein BCR42DRAFT_238510 [Absidia repens]